MEIQGAGGISGPGEITPRPGSSRVPPPRKAEASTGDSAEISEIARYREMLAKVRPIRTGKVEALREAISDPAYETDEKIRVVVERLLEDLGE